MKLVLSEVTREKVLRIDIEQLAKSYGMQLPVSAKLVGTGGAAVGLGPDPADVGLLVE